MYTRRKRLNPIFRWGENVTKQLLTLTLDEIKRNSSSFEKPTAQKFYEKISANSKSLQMTNWSSMKNKIRNCKVLYMKARKRKKESNKSSIDDEKEIKEYLNKICPHYDILDEIFGACLEDTFDFSEDTETHDNASYKDFKGNDHSDTEESQSNLNENLIQDDDPLMAASFAAPKSDLKIADTPTTTKLRNDRKVCSCHWKFWANIEKSKLDIEQKKLEFDQKKFEWQLEKEEAELELKEKELKQQFELRKLELEKEERLEKEKIKLQLEQEERLKKYEIEIKYKNKATKIKVKKKRVIPPARWTESATEHLLQLTYYELKKDPNAFEKPTAQRFYSKISTKSYHLRKTSWVSMKNKLRHLKIHYMRARKLLRFTDDKCDTDYLNKICPYYDILHKIFGVKFKRDNNNMNNKSNEGEFRGFGQWDIRSGGGYTQVGTESTQTSLASSEYIEHVSRLQAIPNSSHSSSMPNLHTAGTLLGKSKSKRKHAFEWTQPASEFLLKLILDEVQKNPGSFEKPTRPAFYKKISASCRQLKNASWMSMKRKLENLHIDYLKAKVWSRESNVNQDQQVVAERLNEICPHYGILDKIFASEAGEQSIATSASEQEYRSVNFWVNDGFDTSVGESGLQQCVSEPALTEAPEITYMDIEKLEDEDVGCSHFASNTTLGFVERPQPFPAYPEELIVSTQDIQPPKLQSHGIGTNTCVSCLAFERRKLEVEHQKLQLEQKKFEWQQEKEGAELELKKRELENQFELKSLELAKEERMEKTKLQLEHKERIKKYEMKMKLDHFKRSSGLYNPHN